MSRELFNRNFNLCSLVCFFYTINFFLIYLVMSDYAQNELNASFWESGFAASIFILGGMLSRIIFGRYMDVLGRKRTVLLGLILGVVVSVGYYFIGGLISLYAIRLVHGFAYGMCTLGISTMVAYIVPPKRRGEGMGYFALSLTIASAIGPFLSMYLLDNSTYEVIFTLAIAVYVVSLMLALLLNVPERCSEAKAEYVAVRGIGRFFEKNVLRISIVSLLFFFSYSGVLSFMTLYGKEIGLSEVAMYYFVMIAASTLVARVFLGKIYDSKGENIVLIPTMLLFTVGMILLSVADSPFVLCLSGLLMGFAIALVFSIGQAIAVKITPSSRYGLATATFSSFTELAYGFGPLVLGLVISMVGYREMYLLCALLSLVSLVAYVALHGIRAKKALITEVE